MIVIEFISVPLRDFGLTLGPGNDWAYLYLIAIQLRRVVRSHSGAETLVVPVILWPIKRRGHI